jgi:hypothetical protein
VVWFESIVRIGAAASYTQAEAGNREVGGLFAGLRTGPISWLGEVDLVRDEGFPEGPRRMVAGLIEGNWLISRGNNLKLTYEYEDPDRNVHHNTQTRASAVYELTPIQFLQLRLGYRKSSGIPQNNQQNASVGFVELHGFF